MTRLRRLRVGLAALLLVVPPIAGSAPTDRDIRTHPAVDNGSDLAAKRAKLAAAMATANALIASQAPGGSGPSGKVTPTSGYFIMPVHGWESSGFGRRFDPVYKRWQLHAGVDIAAAGGTPIRAAASGRVVRAGWKGGYGNYTCIDNGLYQGQDIATCYAHQSAILVHVGQHVTAGQVIGRVGETGAATGYHLHFEVRINGQPVQPLSWLPACLC